MPYRLIGIGNDFAFTLEGTGVYHVGRAVTNECAITDPTVSRQHAELRLTDFGMQVTDAGSNNGTYVNGVRIDHSHVAVGAEITFGKMVFKLEEVPPPVRGTSDAQPAVSPRPMGATIVRPIREPGKHDALDGATTLGRDLAAQRDPAEKDRRKLAILLEVAKGLTRATDLHGLLVKIVEYAFQTLEADRCAILLMDRDGQLHPQISRDRRGAAASGEVPQSITTRAVVDQVAVLTDDAIDDHRFTGQSVVLQKVKSAMCVPLLGSEHKALGVIYVDNFSLTRFSETDLDFLIAFAGIAAVALENGQFAERIKVEALARSNFERFFTPNLAARIASSPDAITLGGDKRRVAVMFTDIRGFTALSETMHPDAMARLLTEYFTEMVECVFRHDGTLDKFIGDSVMALWGAPIGAPDDCDRAMQAALEMIVELDRLNARWTREGRPTLQIGIGLNVGEVFAGNIGSDRRLEYTVIGDAVNVASRLCSAAKGGEILISEDFLRSLGSPPRSEPLPPMALKGKRQPLPVYVVTP